MDHWIISKTSLHTFLFLEFELLSYALLFMSDCLKVCAVIPISFDYYFLITSLHDGVLFNPPLSANTSSLLRCGRTTRKLVCFRRTWDFKACQMPKYCMEVYNTMRQDFTCLETYHENKNGIFCLSDSKINSGIIPCTLQSDLQVMCPCYANAVVSLKWMRELCFFM